MLFKDISIIDENFEIKQHMYVGVKNKIIAYVGNTMPEDDFGEVYDGRNRLLSPAFYNAHSHLPMFLLRGYGENLPLSEWLNNRIFPFEGHLNSKDQYYGALMGAAEMLRFGIAGATEMYLDQDSDAQALADSGVKANVSQSVTCFTDASYYDMPVYQETLRAIEKFNGAYDGRIKVEFALHSEYTTTEKVAREMAEACAKAGSSMHVHVSESRGEVEACMQRHGGKSPVKYLADCGLFDVPAVAAHCVHVDDEDIEILRSKNVTVATNPKSNAKLASGICPVNRLLDAGVNVAIGTDSVASNNNLNMIEEMRFFNLLQKAVNYDPTLITPSQTLYAATRAGALAQGRDDCGLVKEGFRADLAVFDTDKVYMKPEHNLLNNLIYSASGNDVVMTMVDGKVLYKDGIYTTIDIEKTYAECEISRKRILSEI